jgi:asparagine synthase (glutamine-hydrolysing)
MEHGVEVRVPWLDLDLVRWTLTLPDESLLRRGRGKWASRELAADVLSPWIANRPKRGFSAPAGVVSRNGATAGSLGFRQGAYFARARSLVTARLGG